MGEILRTTVEVLIFPTIAGIVIWAVTGRRKDKAAIAEILANLPKAAAEGTVAEETVQAAIELADITTLQAAVKMMTEAFNAERESLTGRIDGTDEALREALSEIEELREDARRAHREMLDMYRRDQYHARVLQALADWLKENLPRLREVYPELTPPPAVEPLHPLFLTEEDGMPNRRWYDGDS